MTTGARVIGVALCFLVLYVADRALAQWGSAAIRHVTNRSYQLGALRLGYAQHAHSAQGPMGLEGEGKWPLAR